MKVVNPTINTARGRVYDEINAFKHDVTGKAAGRTVTAKDAVGAFEEVVSLLNAREPYLAKIYRVGRP